MHGTYSIEQLNMVESAVSRLERVTGDLAATTMECVAFGLADVLASTADGGAVARLFEGATVDVQAVTESYVEALTAVLADIVSGAHNIPRLDEIRVISAIGDAYPLVEEAARWWLDQAAEIA